MKTRDLASKYTVFPSSFRQGYKLLKEYIFLGILVGVIGISCIKNKCSDDKYYEEYASEFGF